MYQSWWKCFKVIPFRYPIVAFCFHLLWLEPYLSGLLSLLAPWKARLHDVYSLRQWLSSNPCGATPWNIRFRRPTPVDVRRRNSPWNDVMRRAFEFETVVMNTIPRRITILIRIDLASLCNMGRMTCFDHGFVLCCSSQTSHLSVVGIWYSDPTFLPNALLDIDFDCRFWSRGKIMRDLLYFMPRMREDFKTLSSKHFYF